MGSDYPSPFGDSGLDIDVLSKKERRRAARVLLWSWVARRVAAQALGTVICTAATVVAVSTII